MYDPYAEFSTHTLSNGLVVYHSHWDRPWVIVEVVVHSGAREDSPRFPGQAHFVEHLVSQNIPDRKFHDVQEFFDICGGNAIFGSTGYLSTHYTYTCPKAIKIFRNALNIFGSMLIDAQLEKEIERERSVILREFNIQHPTKEQLEWNMGIRKALFSGHRLETFNRPLGIPEGFLNITQSELQGFYDCHYTPSNISLIVVGGIGSDQLLEELGKSPFGKEKKGKRNKVISPVSTPPFIGQHIRTLSMSDYSSLKVDQTQYTATWSFPTGPLDEARHIFNRMLRKILFEEIREKRKLAYDIKVNCSYFQDICEYVIRCSISPEYTSQIDGLVHDCILLLPSNRTLFERTIESRKQGLTMIDLSGGALADQVCDDIAMYNEIYTVDRILDEVSGVRFEQMAEIASLLSPERQYNLIITP